MYLVELHEILLEQSGVKVFDGIRNFLNHGRVRVNVRVLNIYLNTSKLID